MARLWKKREFKQIIGGGGAARKQRRSGLKEEHLSFFQACPRGFEKGIQI